MTFLSLPTLRSSAVRAACLRTSRAEWRPSCHVGCSTASCLRHCWSGAPSGKITRTNNPYQYIRLPPALPLSLALTRYTFWQDEADYLRGYAIDGSADVLYINLGIGSHVALHGASFEHIRRGDSLLAPARAVVLRLSRRAPTYHAPTLHLPTMHLPRTYHALYRVLRPSRVPSRVRLERNM